ncbi:hypothetical protein D3C78_1152280 [compost metagenome]
MTLEQLAGGLGDFQVLAGQFRVLCQERLGVALHERVVQRPPGQPQERHPDQLFLEEELEERRTPVEGLDEGGDVYPGLVIADHQVRRIATQVRAAADVPVGGDAEGKDQLVDLGPGLGDPHHRPRGIVAKAPGQDQFEHGEHHQRPEQHQGVEQ